ncbi:hypothetical protein CAPTEDRAFT_129847 [Capitella teleta]|uniref:RWD domain-containing protein n=1 Tax=Capitella teleta TaxID=283909 RepID=R7V1K1_CAPTE|nr:hypothetical protein CAPTEDRAFT_129847 [Capitella teleta]|eukprot:ELU12713.1 hypothetical protein CAPTEDRAFT_129847 [Capitella teleta]
MASPEESQAIISKELAAVKVKFSQIEGAELISCVQVMVQIRIARTERKNIVACFQFPEGYPRTPILLELKSKHLSYKLLDGLTRVCEEEAKKMIGQQQILHIAKFIRKFIDDNPLCICSDEISNLKKLLKTGDEIKLKQKTSQVILKLREGQYYMNVKLTVPDNYPLEVTGVEISDTNFPSHLSIHFASQSFEIARQCVQPPLRKNPKAPLFTPKPALSPVTDYLVTEVIHTYPNAVCPACRENALPVVPSEIITDPSDARFVERVYCKHLYHHNCLDKYMKTPPFIGGKKCLACEKRIFHEKWKATPELAEARWAHQEARHRELAEVVDFLE